MHVAIRPQWTEKILCAIALRRIGGAQRNQEALCMVVGNAPKGSIDLIVLPSPKSKKSHDFDLFIIGQFRRAAAGMQHVGQSIQAGTALAPSVNQQPFEHATGWRHTRSRSTS
jgi:hypothetical protein